MENQVVEGKEQTISYRISRADTFGKRLRGLMFRKKPLHEEGLWILPCNSIHMCFMQFSIDVVFLDQNKRIVKLVENLKPWRMIPPVRNAQSVIELPIGAIQKYSFQVGESIKL
ncbi:DUF192 domain-containing protein [Bacillus timonensis]|nr:DUF192 domain-containing protein [Bacillus timonensis]